MEDQKDEQRSSVMHIKVVKKYYQVRENTYISTFKIVTGKGCRILETVFEEQGSC